MLADLVKSKSVVPTTVEFVDIAGLVKGASKGEGLGNQFLANIRECDSIVQVTGLVPPLPPFSMARLSSQGNVACHESPAWSCRFASLEEHVSACLTLGADESRL